MLRILKDSPHLHVPGLRYKRSIIFEHSPTGKTWKLSKKTHSMLSVLLLNRHQDILLLPVYGP